MSTTLFKNARIITPLDPGRPPAGPHQGKVARFEHSCLLCTDGRIRAVGDRGDIAASVGTASIDREIDCGGLCLMPGLVDPHTHMCFARRREDEFRMRLEGVEYLEILARGGGILSTVRTVAEASDETLFDNTRRHALSALRLGTTTVEIKSGYGLDTGQELRMLAVIARVGRETPLDVVPTFMGAHAVPEAYAGRADAYVDLMVEEMIPAVADQGIARFCDVFCEKNVFSIAQCRRILQAARSAGMGLKMHADEVNDLGGAGLAAEMQAVSADHLLAAGHDNLAAMGRSGVIAVLLPATAYSLRKPYADARRMIAGNVPVALATDCNPGSSYTESMPFVLGLAVVNMRLTPDEALTAATLNAAYAIGRQAVAGSLEPGKMADFILVDGEGPAIFAYHAGVSPVVGVYKGGQRVFCENRDPASMDDGQRQRREAAWNSTD